MNSQQAKLFEDRMANVFGGVDGAPSGDQINLTFQRMAGMMTNGFLNLQNIDVFVCILNYRVLLFLLNTEAAAAAVQGLDENAQLPTEPQLADSLTEALKSLKEGSGLLQEPIPPEGLTGMFSGLNLDDVSSRF